MAEKHTYHLVIASVGETRFDGEVVSATFPGTDGEMTVLAKHEPFVTTLQSGKILVRELSGDSKEFPIESGVLEASGNRAVVLL